MIKKEDKYYKIEQINDIYDYKVDLNLLENYSMILKMKHCYVNLNTKNFITSLKRYMKYIKTVT